MEDTKTKPQAVLQELTAKGGEEGQGHKQLNLGRQGDCQSRDSWGEGCLADQTK